MAEARQGAEIATGREPHCGNETLAFHHDFVEIGVISNGQVADHAPLAMVTPPRPGQVRAADGAHNRFGVYVLAIFGQKVRQARDIGASVHVADPG